MQFGVSKSAFENYIKDCKELTSDLPFGRMLRWMTLLSARFGFMDLFLKIAEKDPVFMDFLFNCVSGHKPYKRIFRETVSISLGLRILQESYRHFILRKVLKADA
jgi:hypothetical protein